MVRACPSLEQPTTPEHKVRFERAPYPALAAGRSRGDSRVLPAIRDAQGRRPLEEEQATAAKRAERAGFDQRLWLHA